MNWLIRHKHLWWVRNLPNILTASRIAVPAAAGLTFWQLHRVKPGWATFWLIITALLVATDFVDGRLARRLEVVSAWGTKADPILDRLVIVSILTFYGIALFGQASPLFLGMWSFVIAVRLFQEIRALKWAHDMLRQGREFPGAVQNGKVKFCWECLAFTAGWVLIIWGGHQRYGRSVAAFSICMAVALDYGWRSLREYQAILTA